MLEKFIFENHLGQRFEGLPNGVYMNENDLRDYSWKYDTRSNRISRFSQGVITRKIPLIVNCASDDEAIAVKNRLMELAEADIEAVLPGKIYIGDYYTNGWITASKKSDYLINKRLCKIDLTLTCDDPAWYREQKYVFLQDMGNISLGGGTDYPYDYPYDYAASMLGQTIVCNSVGSNAFKILIYGEVTNPSVTIGGHSYTVEGTVGKGETLLIDSLNKTITLTTATGNKVNWFDKRVRESYIFEPIPPGQHIAAWTGSFGFDLTVIQKRSEPKWT